MRSSRRQSTFGAVLALAAFGGTACGEGPTGTVELAWEFVDRDGQRIFPGGLFEPAKRDACGLPAYTSATATTVDLGLQLEICDPACDPTCEDEACFVIAPVDFNCRQFRGTERVPAADTPYRFTLRGRLTSPALPAVCVIPSTTCVAIPAPRERRVERGLITDLQVYQIAVDLELAAAGTPRGSIDLEACDCD